MFKPTHMFVVIELVFYKLVPELVFWFLVHKFANLAVNRLVYMSAGNNIFFFEKLEQHDLLGILFNLKAGSFTSKAAQN